MVSKSGREMSTTALWAIEKQNKFFSSSFSKTISCKIPELSWNLSLMANGRQFLTIIGGMKLISITSSLAMISLLVFLMKVYKDGPFVKYELSSNLSLFFNTESGIKLDQFLKPYFWFRMSSMSSCYARSSSGYFDLSALASFCCYCCSLFAIIFICTLKSSYLWETARLSPDSRCLIKHEFLYLKYIR